jgi:hypothetical protein
MENVKGIFEGTRPIREGTAAIGLGLCLALQVLGLRWLEEGLENKRPKANCDPRSITLHNIFSSEDPFRKLYVFFTDCAVWYIP